MNAPISPTVRASLASVLKPVLALPPDEATLILEQLVRIITLVRPDRLLDE